MDISQQIAEAEEQISEARAAFESATTHGFQQIRRDADEALSFWQGRRAALEGLRAAEGERIIDQLFRSGGAS